MRYVFTLALLVLTAMASSAQDMPLSMFLIEGEGWKPAPDAKLVSAPRPELTGLPQEATAVAFSPDGGTVFVGLPNGKAVWAYAQNKQGALVGGEPYCPLRLRKDQTGLRVSDLTVDKAGRIYALTPDGVHVYDPTGRLCGVLLLPISGKPGALSWSGATKNLLMIEVNGTVFTRKLNTTAAR